MSQKTSTEQELLARISELETELKQIKKQKKYGLVWENHTEDVVLQCQNNVPILKEVKNRKISDKDIDKPTNILIEGDNYHALSVLNYTHKGKIDVIYIDPPYNTGDTSWKYNNNYIDVNDEWRHSKWLSMMNERLKLSKNLLKNDGVLICAIDKNEQDNLSILLKELFTDHEIHPIVVVHNPRGVQGKNFSYTNEYAYFVIPKNMQVIGNKKRKHLSKANLNLRDKGGESLRTDAKNCYYPFIIKGEKIVGIGVVPDHDMHPERNVLRDDGSIEVWPIDSKNIERKWRYARQSIESVLNILKVVKNKDFYEIEIHKEEEKFKTVWAEQEYNGSLFGTKLLNEILPESDFDFPKSLELVEDCINSVLSSRKNSIVLDFFAGSGTTGHAVLKTNNNNNQFILCTNNDVGKEKEDLFKIEHNLTNEEFEKVKKQNAKEWQIYCEKNGIASSITYERIKRVMKGYENKKGETVEGLGGNLRYFKTELCDVGKLSRVTDDKKLALTYRVGGLLALKENTFEETEHTDHWQIFSEHNKSTAVYFSEDKTKLHELIEKLGSYKTPVKLYVFSWSKNEYGTELSHYQHVSVSDIPEPILAVYREINNL